VNAARERRERERSEHVRVHEERKQAVAAWVAEHGTADQCARHAAGLLPIDDICEAIADQEFASVNCDVALSGRSVGALINEMTAAWRAIGRPYDHFTFTLRSRSAYIQYELADVHSTIFWRTTTWK
jgi:hypothetical protein